MPDLPLSKEGTRALVRASLLLDAPEGTALSAMPGGDAPLVLVLGAFDGLHRGHQALVHAAVADARGAGASCVAVTFDPDPSEVLRPDAPQGRLLSVADRCRGLRALGADAVVALPFDRALASLSPEDFVRAHLCSGAPVASVHVGQNFRFGAGGAGDVAELRRLGALMGFEVRESPLVREGGERVSSSRVRGLLAQGGQLEAANALLGRCHFLRGQVEHGRGEGTSFGFPTANVRFPAGSQMPAEGVYAGYVTMGATAWPAAINVGAPPTFSGPDELFLEANLIGFTGDAYGADVCVSFVRWLRASRPFSSLEELERVVLGNISWVRDNLGPGGVEVGA